MTDTIRVVRPIEMSDLEPLVCIVCVRHVDPMSDDAEGWVLLPHSVGEGDEHDDAQWKCPICASASDEYMGDPDRRVDAVVDGGEDVEDDEDEIRRMIGEDDPGA